MSLFKKNKGEIINFHFRCTTHTDFELIFNIPIDNNTFNNLFLRAKQKLARTKNIHVRGNPGVIEEFDVPKEEYKLIKVILNKKINQVRKEVKEDKIEMLGYDVTKGKYQRDKENTDKWICEITIKGNYIKK